MEALARPSLMPLEKSESHIFYSLPESLEVNERAWTEYSMASDADVGDELIDDLISQLARQGPFVALAQVGPEFYSTSPGLVNDTLPGVPVFGWKKGSPRAETNITSPVIVLGARKAEKAPKNRAYVIYFSPSRDVTKGEQSIRTHQPLSDKIYVVTQKTFQISLLNTFPPVSAIAHLCKDDSACFFEPELTGNSLVALHSLSRP